MSGKLVLVTGVTGFIAAHVASELLARGYRVRGTTRGTKAKTLSDANTVAGLEFTQVDNLATGDFTTALIGVDLVIHVASPLPGECDVKTQLTAAVDGTLNILRQAADSNIEKIVVTSSYTAVVDPSSIPAFCGVTFSENDWGDATTEKAQANANDPFYVYVCSKTLAERAVWRFAAEHPEVDIATILPGFVFGPFSSLLPTPSPSRGTNAMVYGLIKGQHPPVGPPFVVDVRDVAVAHILAIDVPRAPRGSLESKRFLVNSRNMTWKEVADHLRIARAGKVNVPPTNTISDLPGPAGTLDTSRSKHVLGMKYIDTRKTFEDAVDSLLEAERTTACFLH